MKHKHSEVIKAFVDGIQCEYFSIGTDRWVQINDIAVFSCDVQVRIKPEPKPKEYYEEDTFDNQYLYVYRDRSNNISVYHTMMPEAFNHFYYMGKVRVEK